MEFILTGRKAIIRIIQYVMSYRRQWTVQSGATIVYTKCKHNSAPWIEQIIDVYEESFFKRHCWYKR